MDTIIDALDWLEVQFKPEWERDYRAFQGGLNLGSDIRSKTLYWEERMYKDPKPTPAMEAAVQALSTWGEDQRKRKERRSSMHFPEGNGDGIDSKIFVKLKDKESIVGVFRGEPYSFKKHWVSQRSEVCSGDKCTHCANGNKAGFSFRINLITKESKDTPFVAKVWERGWMDYKTLKALHEGEYPLDKTKLRITRSGSGRNDTSYTVLPCAEHRLTPEVEKEIAAVTLHELKNLAQESESKSNGAESTDSMSDIPF